MHEWVEYIDEENNIIYYIKFLTNNLFYQIDICYKYLDNTDHHGLIGELGKYYYIRNERIFIENKSDFFMSDKTIEYINKLIKLKAFI